MTVAWIREHWLILFLLIGYVAIMARHAVAGRRLTKNVTDYYVGGRRMGGIALGISFFATYSSTNSFVGFAGQTYTYGLPWLLFGPMLAFFAVIAWRWVAPRLRDATEKLGSVTIPDFIGFRFESNVARFGAALIVVFASLLYMTAVFKGAGNLLEAFLDIPYAASIVVVLLVVMLYTAVGGFISVVKTDVLQGSVMMLAAVLMFVGTTRAAGGIGSIFAVKDLPGGAELFTWEAAIPFPVLLGILIAGTFKLIVEPRQLSRFYAMKDRRAATQGMWISASTFLVGYALLLPLGIYAHHLLPAGVSDTDQIIPQLVSNRGVFHPAASAFLVLAIVAAAMSSLDSVLLVLATTCERDLAGLWRPPRSEEEALRATRAYVAILAVVTALIALKPPGGIVTLTAFSGSLYAACFFPALVLGLFWKRGTAQAVLTSFIVGISTLLFWRFVPGGDGVHEVFPALLLSTGVYIAGSVKAPPLAVARDIAR
jgi:SSS family transporter